MGPTASGKTALAVSLAAQLPVEIISVDSALVYRGFDIGTAKPDTALQARAPHRLVDIRDPSESYSAAEFRHDALAAMRDITQAGRIPLLVGGTMRYFRALERGLAVMPGADPVVRARLAAQAQARGWGALHAELARIDPVAAERIHPNDPQRIQRALEVHALTGRPLSTLWRDAADALPYRPVKLVLLPTERSWLHQRIEARWHGMLAQGLIAEVEALRRRGDVSPDMPALRAVGYRQVWEYLEGRYDYAEMAARGLYACRQLAKRQLTWLRREVDGTYLACDAPSLTERALAAIMEHASAATT